MRGPTGVLLTKTEKHDKTLKNILSTGEWQPPNAVQHIQSLVKIHNTLSVSLRMSKVKMYIESIVQTLFAIH